MSNTLSATQDVIVRLEMLGGPKYNAEGRKAAATTRSIGRASATSAVEMKELTHRTWLQNQAMFTLRRYAFYGTLAITAMGAAIIKWGAGYLSALQNARVALGPVVRDQGKLNNYLNQLFQISKFSPFVIKDIAIAFRTMFAQLSSAGIGAQKTINVIKALTDYLSFTGHTSPANIERVSQAIAKMANMGRLTGLTIRSLAAGGIPIYPILQKQFGISKDNIANISKLNISTDAVLTAILQYAKTNRGVRGAAQRISLGTFSGLLQVGRDTLSQISGHLIGGGFKGGQSWLGNILRQGGPLDKISKIQNPSGTYHAILNTLGAGAGLRLLLDIMYRIGRLFVTVIIPAFAVALHGLTAFYPVLWLLDAALKQVQKHGKLFAAIIAVWTTYLVISFGAEVLVNTALFIMNTLVVGLILSYRRFAVFLATRFIPVLLSVAIGLWAAFGVFILIAAAVVAVTAGLVILYYKWKPFHDLVDKTWNLLKNGSIGVRIALTLAFGPLGIALQELILIQRHWAQLKKDAKHAPSAFANFFHKISNLSAPTSFPGHAWGGIGSGLSWVGEHGPELVNLPSGSRIIPNNQLSSSLSMNAVGGGGGDDRPIIVQVMLDRKVLAQGVARAKSDLAARK